MLLRDTIDDFLLEQRVRGNSAATLTFYSNVLRFFSDFVGNVRLSDITLRMCKEYYMKLFDDYDNSVSIQTYIRGLRAFLRWCYENELTDEDICSKFKLPKATRKVIDILTDSEIHTLYNSLSVPGWLSARNRLIVSLMLDSGLRLHEVVSLTMDSVHLAERYIIVQNGKGDKQRIVPFGEFTSSVIIDYLSLTKFAKNRVPLIIKVSEERLGYEGVTDNTIKQLFRKFKLRTGIKRLKPHLLRHTFATRYLENGGNIYTLQTILGHTSLEMVKRYLHLATTRIRSDFPKFSPLDNFYKIKNQPPGSDWF